MVVAKKQPEVSQEKIEHELKAYYIDCDKLLFIAQLLALKEELPEELKSEKYKKEDVLLEIADYIEQLEKLTVEENSPVGYMGYDLKSAAIMVAMALLFPEAKTKVVEQLMSTYTLGKSEKYAHHRFYTTNWDRCVKFLYAYPDLTRDDLPTLSSLLRHITMNKGDVTSGPVLTIRSLIDMSTVELTDIGENYRILLREETMAKRKTNANATKQAQKQQQSSEAVTTTITETVTTECGGNKQEFELVSDTTQTVEEMKEEFEQAIKEQDMAKAVKDEAAKLADNLKDEAAKTIEEIDMSGLTSDVLVNETSWTEDKEERSSTTKKVLLGLGGLALLGGIGYAIYSEVGAKSSAFNNGFDLV